MEFGLLGTKTPKLLALGVLHTSTRTQQWEGLNLYNMNLRVSNIWEEMSSKITGMTMLMKVF